MANAGADMMSQRRRTRADGDEEAGKLCVDCLCNRAARHLGGRLVLRQVHGLHLCGEMVCPSLRAGGVSRWPAQPLIRSADRETIARAGFCLDSGQERSSVELAGISLEQSSQDLGRCPAVAVLPEEEGKRVRVAGLVGAKLGRSPA